MKKKTASELFGDFLPYPIINSVTLESGGSLVENASKNPHILTEQADQTSQTTSSDMLKTKIIVSVRDVLDDDDSTSFFDNDISDCIAFVVIQCTDASKAAAYIQNKEILYAHVDTYMQGSGNYLSGLEFKMQLMSTDGDTFPKTTINGDNVHEKPYFFEFESTNTQPSHLSYFAVCVVDKASVSTKYEIDMDHIFNSFSSVDISQYMESNYHIVIDGGSVVNTKYVYLLPDGQQWTGPVHIHKGIAMAGKAHTDSPHPSLTKTMVTSDIVRDFRDLTDLPTTKEDFYQDQSALASLITTPYDKEFAQDIVDNKKSSLSYDIINYSMPFKNNLGQSISKVGVLLALDTRELQIRHGLIKRGSGAGPLAQIKQLTLYRKDMTTEEIKQVSSGPPGVFSINISGASQKHTFFHIPDLAPAGNYEYYAEIELDRTSEINLIKQMLTSLRNYIIDLDNYYMLATKPFLGSVTSHSKESGSPVLDSSNYGNLSGQKISTPFNYSTGKFKKEFTDNPDAQLLYNNLLSLTPTINGVATMLFDPVEAASKTSTFQKVIHPAEGTPDGILMVKKVVTNIMQSLEKVFGGKTKIISQGFFSGWGQDVIQKNAIKEKPNEKIIINLKSKLQLKDNIDYGYDYLPNYKLQGVPKFSLGQFLDHVGAEIDKYIKPSSQPPAGAFGQFETVFGEITNNLSPTNLSQNNLCLTTRRTKAGNTMITNVAGLPITNPEKVKNLQEKVFLSIVDRNISGIEANNKKLDYFPQSTGLDISDLNQTKQLEEIFSTKGVAVLDSNPYAKEELVELSAEGENTSFLQSSEEDPNKNNPNDYNGKLLAKNFSQSILFNMIRCTDNTFKKLKHLDYYRLDLLDEESGNFATATIKNDATPEEGQENIIFSIREKVINLLGDDDLFSAMQQHIREELSDLPIQVLALILGSRHKVESFDYTNPITNPFSKTNNSDFIKKAENRRKDFELGYAEHWFNYDNLVKVEYLDTFSEGLASPQWKPLDNNILNMSPPSQQVLINTGETASTPAEMNMLCRLVKYDDNLLNIKRAEVLELPIYNEYFLINIPNNEV